MRPATFEDAPALMRMGRAFATAAEVVADDESMRKTFAMLLQNGGLFVTGEPVCGMAGAIIYPNYFRLSRVVAQELFWWIDPEARGSGAGRDLLDGLERWALVNGADSLTMISLDGLDGASIGQWYESRGYRPLERHYRKVF